MKLLKFDPRPDWQQRMLDVGFVYHSFDGAYWMDNIGVELSQAEWDGIGRASLEIHAMGIDMVAEAVKSGDFSAWRLSDLASELVSESWLRGDPSLYGRFDFTFSPEGVAKAYEYNADTPTSIMEASLAQSDWAQARGVKSSCALEEHMPKAFAKFAAMGAQKMAIAGLSTSVEDTANLFPMVEWARMAGIDASWRPIEQMQFIYGAKQHGFDGEGFEWIFKLYPWEFFVADNAKHLSQTTTRFMEPAWKMLLSTKAFMAEAWRRHPRHPNLLPTYFEGQEGPGLENGYARKPILSREGANVEIFKNNAFIQKEVGPYGREGFVKQAYCAMPEPEPAMRFTLGGWIAGDSFAGTCARYTDDHVVTNVSWTCGCCIGS